MSTFTRDRRTYGLFLTQPATVTSSTKSIALFFDPGILRDDELLRGIYTYARGRAVPWNFHFAAADGLIDSETGRLTRLDGMIIANLRPEWQQQICTLSRRTPYVLIGSEPGISPSAEILPDDVAIGRAIAEHFLDRGFRSFGFCGFSGFGFSEDRLRGFRDILSSEGQEIHVFSFSGGPAGCYSQSQAKLERWLKGLPAPVAIMAVMDERARQVVRACRHANLRVPDDVAICGSDDHSVCQMESPHLSSVPLDRFRTGYVAAELLDGFMHGRPALSAPVRIAPRPLVVRQSSDAFAARDDEVASALRWIRDHAARPIRVDQVVAAAMVSRTSLERKFRRSLGRTIQEAIWNAHVERAKSLLANSADELVIVARSSGFRGVHRLHQVFRQHTGLTPAEYRKAHRGPKIQQP